MDRRIAAAPLCLANHAERRAIFHGSRRIVAFQLYQQNIAGLAGKPLETSQRRIAYERFNSELFHPSAQDTHRDGVLAGLPLAMVTKHARSQEPMSTEFRSLAGPTGMLAIDLRSS